MVVPRALARAQAIVNRTTLNTTAVVSRLGQSADDAGGFTDAYTVVGTYPCSFSRYQITPIEREGTITVQAISVWMFVFPAGTDVRQTDRIVSQGRTFEVTSSASGSFEVAKRVICTELS